MHYPLDQGRELHAVYHMLSITHNRRLRLEVSVPDADPHIPSLVDVYPANDWHERETWDFFGIIFDGHPALTRIEMPDDWKGHPQREGLPAGRYPGRVPGCDDPATRRAEGLRMSTSADQADTAEGRVYNLSGQDWDEVVAAADEAGEAAPATNASSSTWARSTRRPTGCCG